MLARHLPGVLNQLQLIGCLLAEQPFILFTRRATLFIHLLWLFPGHFGLLLFFLRPSKAWSRWLSLLLSR